MRLAHRSVFSPSRFVRKAFSSTSSVFGKVASSDFLASRPSEHPGESLIGIEGVLHQRIGTALCGASSLSNGDGRVVRRSVFNAESQLLTTVQVWSMVPGTSQGLHAHRDGEPLGEIEELYICLSGQGTVKRGGNAADMVFESGDAVLVRPNTLHGVCNQGTTPLVMIFLFGPQRSSQPHRLRGTDAFWSHVPSMAGDVLISDLDRAAARTDERFHSGEGAITRRSVFCGESLMEDTIQLWTIPSGSSQGLHCHSSDRRTCDQPAGYASLGVLEELYLCIAGNGTFLGVDGVTMPMTTGDAFLARPGTMHGVRNDGHSPLIILVLWGAPHLAGTCKENLFRHRGSLLPLLAHRHRL